MKALILYSVFITIGAVISAAIGYYVEINVSSAVSLVVFLALFFANFAISWLGVVLVIDGSLKDVGGLKAQLAIEKSGRAAAAAAKEARAA